MPGIKTRCPMSKDLLINVVAQTIWCPKLSQVQEMPIPRGVKKAELWQELRSLLKDQNQGADWPKTILDHGITKSELTKYVFALKPNHRYFSKKFQEDFDNSDYESDSSFDSAFE